MKRVLVFLPLLQSFFMAACAAAPTPVAPTPQTPASATFTPELAVTPVPPSASPPAPEPMRLARGHAEESFVRISWSPDGSMLASYGNEDQVIVWDANTLEPIHTLTQPGTAFIGFASFSPSGRWLLVGEARHVEIPGGGNTAFDVSVWDLQNNTRLSPLTDTSDLIFAAWNDDETLLAFKVYNEEFIHFWAIPGSGVTAPEPIPLPPFEVGKLHWLPDGTLTAVGVGEDGFVRWRSTSPGTLTPAAGQSFEGTIYAYSPDGTLAASLADLPVAATVSTSDLGLFIWGTAHGELRTSLQSHDIYGLGGLAFSPDNAWLAAANHAVNVYANIDNVVRIWDLASGGVAATLPGSAAEIVSIALSPDGKTLAAGEANGGIRLWQLDAYLHPPVTPTPIPTSTPFTVSNVTPVFLTSLSVPGVGPDDPGQLNTLRWTDPNTLHFITLSHYADPLNWRTAWQQRISEYDLNQGQVIVSDSGAAQFREGMAPQLRAYSPDGTRFAHWLSIALSPEQGTDAVVEVLDTATNALLFQIPADQIGSGNYFA